MTTKPPGAGIDLGALPVPDPDLLPITLEPSARIVWASAAARREWEPKIALAASAWSRAEQDSVAKRLRPAGQTWLQTHEFVTFQDWLKEHKLAHRVVRFTGSFKGFLHGGYPSGSDMVVVLYGDDDCVLSEEHFGYPRCCVKSFMWHATTGDLDPMPAWYQCERGAPHLTNPLLRYIGVRALPHLPCSNLCIPSLDNAALFLSLMPPDASTAALELLSLPMTWDRYRGVAIVTTKHFKVVATSTPKRIREVIHVA